MKDLRVDDLIEVLITSEYELMCNSNSIDDARKHYFLMQDLVKQQIERRDNVH